MQPIDWLFQFEGEHERSGGGSNHRLDQFWALAGRGGEGLKVSSTPWCQATVCAALASTGHSNIVNAIPKYERLMARSWDVNRSMLAGRGVQRIGGPEAFRNGLARRGDIVTYTRGGTSRNLDKLVSGHVALYTGEYNRSTGKLEALGGNQSNKVNRSWRKTSSVLSVYRLPQAAMATSAKMTVTPDFKPALERVLEHEGGFVNHPRDPGGATNKGITIATYRRYINPNGTVNDLRRLTTAQAGVVYKAQYWDKVSGDKLPPGLNYAVFDFGVNSGPSRAAKFLQRIVNVDVDGEIGPITLNAVYQRNARQLAGQICDDRLAWMQTLSTWNTFGKGWSRRVKGVKAHAVAEAPNGPWRPATQNFAEQPRPQVRPRRRQPQPQPGAGFVLQFLLPAFSIINRFIMPEGRGRNRGLRGIVGGILGLGAAESAGVVKTDVSPVLNLVMSAVNSPQLTEAISAFGTSGGLGTLGTGLVSVLGLALKEHFTANREDMRDEEPADDPIVTPIATPVPSQPDLRELLGDVIEEVVERRLAARSGGSEPAARDDNR